MEMSEVRARTKHDRFSCVLYYGDQCAGFVYSAKSLGTRILRKRSTRPRWVACLAWTALAVSGCASQGDYYSQAQQQISMNCQSIAAAGATNTVIAQNKARAEAGNPQDNRVSYTLAGVLVGSLIGYPIEGGKAGYLAAQATEPKPGQPLPPLSQEEASAIYNNALQSGYANCMNREITNLQRAAYQNSSRPYNSNFRFNVRVR